MATKSVANGVGIMMGMGIGFLLLIAIAILLVVAPVAVIFILVYVPFYFMFLRKGNEKKQRHNNQWRVPMKFQMIDGELITGRSYTDIVKKMAGMKLMLPGSLKRYRAATAKRVANFYQTNVDVSTDATFVASLEDSGLIKRLS